jgi:hypothetical protein
LSAADLFIPRYRPATAGRWSLRIMPAGVVPGYWSGPSLASQVPVLLRDGEPWMSITPLEVESEEIGIRAGRGHVLIFGLGMGWSMAAVAARSAVTSVTIVERDPDVLQLHRDLDLLAQLGEAERCKVRIVQGDAFDYRPDGPVDLLFPDIWQKLASGDRFEEVGRMQAKVGAGAIYFWGQELELARHAIAAGRRLDEAGISATAAESGLPLVGPGEPGYAAKVAEAAGRWMRDLEPGRFDDPIRPEQEDAVRA